MRSRLIVVPYDSGRYGWRMGMGPLHYLATGLVEELSSRGVEADTVTVRLDSDGSGEVASAFQVARRIAAEVTAARGESRFPIVLAGNCISALGTVAALDAGKTAVIWFDAHGDLNTPESTRSGFLDGMSLAALTGRCWTELRIGIPGCGRVADERVVLVGARDLDPAERKLLELSPIDWLRVESLRQGNLGSELARLRNVARSAYVHIDLDVLDIDEGSANQFACSGGLTVDELIDSLRQIRQQIPVSAVALTAYDPAFDTDQRIRAAAPRILAALAE